MGDESGRHVLIVMFGWADSGGGTILPRQVARALARRGDRISVVYAAVEHRPELPPYALVERREDGVDLYGIHNRPSVFMDARHPTREIDDPRVTSLFGSLLRRLDPDVCHVYNLHNLGMALPALCKARGIPTVLSSNNYWTICPRLYLFDDQLERCPGSASARSRCGSCVGSSASDADFRLRHHVGQEVLNRHIDVHLAVSHRCKEIFVANGADPARIRVVHQQPESVDWIWEQVGRHRVPAGQRAEPLRVGFIGSALPHKGAHLLTQALQPFPSGSMRGIVHGDIAAGYGELLRRLDPAGAVELRGAYRLEALPGLLRELDVVVVPSTWEDCAPFVVAEALAARLPVLGARMGGIPDFFEDGVTGLTFAAGDAADLGRALLRLHSERGLLARMQRAIVAPQGFDAYVSEVRRVHSELVRAPELVEVGA